MNNYNSRDGDQAYTYTEEQIIARDGYRCQNCRKDVEQLRYFARTQYPGLMKPPYLFRSTLLADIAGHPYNPQAICCFCIPKLKKTLWKVQKGLMSAKSTTKCIKEAQGRTEEAKAKARAKQHARIEIMSWGWD